MKNQKTEKSKAQSEVGFEQVVMERDYGMLECDLCNTPNTFKEIYHFSGVLKGKQNNHVHLCTKCVKEKGLVTDYQF